MNAFVIADATHPELPIVYVNPAFESLTGYSAAEVMGKNCRFLQSKDKTQPGLVELRDALTSSRSCHVVLRNYKKDGTFFWNDFSLTPIFDGHGSITHFVGVQNVFAQDKLVELPAETFAAVDVPVPAAPAPVGTGGRLGDQLIASGVVTPEVVAAALQYQKGSSMRLGEVLVSQFGVPEKEIILALGGQLETARADHKQIDLLKSTAIAVRLAQKTMEAVPEAGLPLFSVSRPLSDAGGDTFYRTQLADGSHLLLLADVAGHSVISSYAVAAFLGMVSALTHDWRGLEHLIAQLNVSLLRGPFLEIPICISAAHWDIERGRLHIINAGLPHCMLYRKSTGQTHPIPINGLPIGMLESLYTGERVIALDEGDRLLLGSDGFYELQSPAKVDFQDVAPDHWSRLGALPLGEALLSICRNASEHGAGIVNDDIMAVAIEQPAVVLALPGFRMHIISTFEEIDRVCERIVDFIQKQACLNSKDPDWHFDLLLVAREALTNAMIHGNSEDPEKTICVCCLLDEGSDELRLTITDEGKGLKFSPPSADIDLQTSERGRGITIIRAFTKSATMTGSELVLNFSIGAISDE